MGNRDGWVTRQLRKLKRKNWVYWQKRECDGCSGYGRVWRPRGNGFEVYLGLCKECLEKLGE